MKFNRPVSCYSSSNNCSSSVISATSLVSTVFPLHPSSAPTFVSAPVATKIQNRRKQNAGRSGGRLATRDHMALFERTDVKGHVCSQEFEKLDYSINRHPEFRYKTILQSHEPVFDYLKSLEIKGKINKNRSCQAANGALFLLSTNDKTIKFWKVQEKKLKKVSKMSVDSSQASANGPISNPRWNLKSL